MEKISAITKLKGLEGVPADAEVRSLPCEAADEMPMLTIRAFLARWPSTASGAPFSPSFSHLKSQLTPTWLHQGRVRLDHARAPPANQLRRHD